MRNACGLRKLAFAIIVSRGGQRPPGIPEDDGSVTLPGRGVQAPGYSSATFNEAQAVLAFTDSRRQGLSACQAEWLDWVVFTHGRID